MAGWRGQVAGIEVTSKLIFNAILNQPQELKLEKSHRPPFLKGGGGDLILLSAIIMVHFRRNSVNNYA